RRAPLCIPSQHQGPGDKKWQIHTREKATTTGGRRPLSAACLQWPPPFPQADRQRGSCYATSRGGERERRSVVWRSWGISFRHSQERIFPREVKKLHKDFLLDDQLHKQMKSIFGNKMLDYVLSLCQGHYDFLVRMPENLIIRILSFLNADDIAQLAKTCKKFRQLCITEDFWEKVRKVQDKYTLDAKFPAYKKTIRHGYLTKMQRRQTTFF
uniref:F-box domain-containing protein n=1 Tax=Salvator merianae TaxID=96440 RepID=A0A8D0DGB0_SALMN